MFESFIYILQTSIVHIFITNPLVNLAQSNIYLHFSNHIGKESDANLVGATNSKQFSYQHYPKNVKDFKGENLHTQMSQSNLDYPSISSSIATGVFKE